MKGKKEGVEEFFAHYKFRKLREPFFCEDEIMERVGIKFVLDSKLPGIIPISEEQFNKLLKVLKNNL